MKLLQRTIQIFVWSSIFLLALLLTDWIGREIVMNLPW